MLEVYDKTEKQWYAIFSEEEKKVYAKEIRGDKDGNSQE